MGIRVHKALCYALTNVLTKSNKGWHIDDPRFVDNINDEEMTEKPYDKAVYVKFLKWVHNNRAECIRLLGTVNPPDRLGQPHLNPIMSHYLNMRYGGAKKNSKIPATDYSDIYIHNGEYGLGQVVGFVELFSPAWYRSDDSIDYVDETNPSKDQINYFKRIPYGIYPYSGMMYKIRHPEIAEYPKPKTARELGDYMSSSEYQSLVGDFSPYRGPAEGDEVGKYVRACYRPEIPDSVLLYTYYMGFFKDWQKTVQELQPILYVYWS